jgi:hypothetical protein
LPGTTVSAGQTPTRNRGKSSVLQQDISSPLLYYNWNYIIKATLMVAL